MFLDFWNDFLTIEGFADYYWMSDKRAETIITIGRRIYNKNNQTQQKY